MSGQEMPMFEVWTRIGQELQYRVLIFDVKTGNTIQGSNIWCQDRKCNAESQPIIEVRAENAKQKSNIFVKTEK